MGSILYIAKSTARLHQHRQSLVDKKQQRKATISFLKQRVERLNSENDHLVIENSQQSTAININSRSTVEEELGRHHTTGHQLETAALGYAVLLEALAHLGDRG